VSSREDLRYGLDLAGLDPGALVQALGEAGLHVARRPDVVARAGIELAREQSGVVLEAARRLLGADGDGTATRERDDRRFKDRAWSENPFLFGLVGSYLAGTRCARRLLEEAELPAVTRRKAEFALDLLLDAAAPSNLPWLNPAVVKEAIDTGGLSLVRGLSNFLTDLVENAGRPRQVDRRPFELGKNLAATPGRVVFRNHLIELLAYEPQTDAVFAEPILYSPPWINKYYVMDLAPGRSFIEYAVRNGFTVLAVSYRNPDEAMAKLTLDDYLRDGLLAALDRAQELTRAPRVNIVSVCLGGTLAMIALAVLAARGQAERVGWATLNNVLVDFSEPGPLGVFTDEQTIERIERRSARRGFLESTELAGTFDWLRGNDLVWNYVVSGWYMGKDPPAFDILAWNADSTRLPAAMHSQYLRACYLENRLVRPNALELDGTPVDLARVETPLYVLSAENDHIAPWRSAYRTTQLVAGQARHVLTSGGHIAGMVNPPGNPKASYRVNGDTPPDPDEWLRGAETVTGSWWEDWSAWAAERSGERVQPPKLSDGEPAPGTYVRG
jgi:polyhydroxyalkanoate synthase